MQIMVPRWATPVLRKRGSVKHSSSSACLDDTPLQHIIPITPPHNTALPRRWCAIREELLKHPDGPAILRKGAPFDLHPTPHPPDLAPQGPLITLASDDHEGPPGAPGGAAGAEGGAEMQPGYKSRRPSSLCVDGLETYKSLRSLQAPYVGTPLTGAGVSTAVKRKRPSGGGDGTGGAAKVKVCVRWGGDMCG